MLTPPQEGVDRPRRVLHGHVAMAAFLIQAAESRMMLLEALEGRERLGDFIQVPLAQRDQIEHVAVFGHLGSQRLGSPEGLCVLPALEELPYAANFPFYR